MLLGDSGSGMGRRAELRSQQPAFREAPCVKLVVASIEPDGGKEKLMARYGKAFKERAVARLLPPESASVEEVSRRIGVSVSTLERWRADALAEGRKRRVPVQPLHAAHQWRQVAGDVQDSRALGSVHSWASVGVTTQARYGTAAGRHPG